MPPRLLAGMLPGRLEIITALTLLTRLAPPSAHGNCLVRRLYSGLKSRKLHHDDTVPAGHVSLDSSHPVPAARASEP